MRPVLFHIGPLPVYSYSVFMVVAWAAGLGYAYREARKKGLDPVYVLDLSLVLFFSGIIGARLLFVLVDFKRFAQDPREVYRIWNGGLVFYGGLITAVAAGMVYLKIKKLDLWTWADLLAPTAMLALVFGRIGCFLNGCCYGKPAPHLLWGIVYPPSHPSPSALARVKVHPAPLYASLAALIIFFALAFLEPRKKFKGQVFWSMVLLYAIARFILEFFRGDPRGSVPGTGLSTSQFISVFAAVFALIALYVFSRKAKLKEAASS